MVEKWVKQLEVKIWKEKLELLRTRNKLQLRTRCARVCSRRIIHSTKSSNLVGPDFKTRTGSRYECFQVVLNLAVFGRPIIQVPTHMYIPVKVRALPTDRYTYSRSKKTKYSNMAKTLKVSCDSHRIGTIHIIGNSSAGFDSLTLRCLMS